MKLVIHNDKVFIIDNIINTISCFTFEGLELWNLVLSNYTNITAFDVEYEGIYWVADQDGTRLTRFDQNQKASQINNDFCFMDVNFTFGKIVYLDAWSDPPNKSCGIIDYQSNYLITLREQYYE